MCIISFFSNNFHYFKNGLLFQQSKILVIGSLPTTTVLASDRVAFVVNFVH